MTGRVVAFLGVAGSGKDHKAAALAAPGYLRIDFKDALLDMASDLAGHDVREDYDWFKSHIVGVRRPKNTFALAAVKDHGDSLAAACPEVMTGRRLLQRLGTEVMRGRDRDYWCRAWHGRAHRPYFEGRDIVCADCRFPNEVAFLRQFSAKFVFSDYKSPRYAPSMNTLPSAWRRPCSGGGWTTARRSPPMRWMEP